MTKDSLQQVPVRPAATLMLVIDKPKLQVLMMQRTHKAVFAGNMWVFPGGRVEEQDQLAIQDYQDKLPELPDSPTETLAFCVAAIRETFEEAGILLARDTQTDRPLALGQGTDHADRFRNYRDALHANRLSFALMLQQNQLQLALEKIHYLARWITPPGSPRRFDTRFFIADAPTEQEPEHDNTELVRHAWFEPDKALDLHAKGDMVMMTPTLAALSVLARFQHSAELFQALTEADAAMQIRVQDATNQLVYPNEAGYESANRVIEFGWMRLLPTRAVHATGLPAKPQRPRPDE